jgi:hypothetical protein
MKRVVLKMFAFPPSSPLVRKTCQRKRWGLRRNIQMKRKKGIAQAWQDWQLSIIHAWGKKKGNLSKQLTSHRVMHACKLEISFPPRISPFRKLLPSSTCNFTRITFYWLSKGPLGTNKNTCSCIEYSWISLRARILLPRKHYLNIQKHNRLCRRDPLISVGTSSKDRKRP